MGCVRAFIEREGNVEVVKSDFTGSYAKFYDGLQLKSALDIRCACECDCLGYQLYGTPPILDKKVKQKE